MVTAQFVSELGDGITTVALPLYVYARTQSALATSLTFMAELLAGVVFGIIGGVLADGLDRQRVLIASYVARAALLVATVAVGPLWLVIVFGVAARAGGQLDNPSFDAMVPEHADGDLQQVLALRRFIQAVSYTIGPAVGRDRGDRGRAPPGPAARQRHLPDRGGAPRAHPGTRRQPARAAVDERGAVARGADQLDARRCAHPAAPPDGPAPHRLLDARHGHRRHRHGGSHRVVRGGPGGSRRLVRPVDRLLWHRRHPGSGVGRQPDVPALAGRHPGRVRAGLRAVVAPRRRRA